MKIQSFEKLEASFRVFCNDAQILQDEDPHGVLRELFGYSNETTMFVHAILELYLEDKTPQTALHKAIEHLENVSETSLY